MLHAPALPSLPFSRWLRRRPACRPFSASLLVLAGLCAVCTPRSGAAPAARAAATVSGEALLAHRPALGAPPGSVVFASADPQRQFVGSPSILVLADGSLLASHDNGGAGAGERRGRTSLRVSTDRGATWSLRAEVENQKWSSLFEHRGAIYLIGVTARGGDMIVRRSNDGGRTWTEPKDARHGLLAKGKFHCAPTPVVVHAGRVWRAFEEFAPTAPVRAFRAFVLSAPEEADLLDARSWTRTNALAIDKRWLATRNGEWLEGNVVVAPDGSLVDILRVESHPATDAPFELPGAWRGIPRFEVAARLSVSTDGRTVAFDPARDFIHFIGSEAKFTIRRDPRTGRYWTLGNKITNPQSGADWVRSPHHQRNVIALCSSDDLRDWREHYRMLRYQEGTAVVKEGSRVGFQYVDWQFDGEDIVAVCRTCWDGLNYHDANMITFHRVRGFRTLTPADSPAELSRQ